MILDVGAHVGYFSILAADANPNCKAYGFEPVPETFDILCSNIAAAGFQHQITAHRLALGERDSHEMLLRRGSSGSTLAKDFWEDSSQLERIQVQMVRLDSWSKAQDVRFTNQSVVKQDIETFEPQALRGAEQVLMVAPALLCEVLGTFTEELLERVLFKERWRYFWIGPEGISERRRISGDPAWKFNNYLFLTHDSPYLLLIGAR